MMLQFLPMQGVPSKRWGGGGEKAVAMLVTTVEGAEVIFFLVFF